MVTIHTLYDRAAHLTDEEYYCRTGERVNVQAEVEQPEVNLLVLGSSTVQDQAATIGDRLEGLRERAYPVKTSQGVYVGKKKEITRIFIELTYKLKAYTPPDVDNCAKIITGLEVYDCLRFFTGDHPAADFERGTQQGGTFPCGDCGIKANMIDDQAHSLRRTHRTIQQLQSLATAGTLGNSNIYVIKTCPPPLSLSLSLTHTHTHTHRQKTTCYNTSSHTKYVC